MLEAGEEEEEEVEVEDDEEEEEEEEDDKDDAEDDDEEDDVAAAAVGTITESTTAFNSSNPLYSGASTAGTTVDPTNFILPSK